MISKLRNWFRVSHERQRLRHFKRMRARQVVFSPPARDERDWSASYMRSVKRR